MTNEQLRLGNETNNILEYKKEQLRAWKKASRFNNDLKLADKGGQIYADSGYSLCVNISEPQFECLKCLMIGWLENEINQLELKLKTI